MYLINRFQRGWAWVLIFFALASPGFAQITPPGLGRDSNTDLWLAAGLRQNLDFAGKVQSMTYLGLGRESTPANHRLFQHQGIVVINQEFFHQFHKKWQYSAALSYRKQNEYKDTTPFDRATPSYKQEFRAYSRLSWTPVQKRRIKLTLTARQELRKFFAPDFEAWEENMQLRTRLKAMLLVYLTHNKQHNLTVAAEDLFTSSLPHNKDQWNRLEYAETRLSAFYTFSPKNARVAYSLGYMQDLVGSGEDLKYVNYFALDVVFKNIFSGRRPSS